MRMHRRLGVITGPLRRSPSGILAEDIAAFVLLQAIADPSPTRFGSRDAAEKMLTQSLKGKSEVVFVGEFEATWVRGIVITIRGAVS